MARRELAAAPTIARAPQRRWANGPTRRCYLDLCRRRPNHRPGGCWRCSPSAPQAASRGGPAARRARHCRDRTRRRPFRGRCRRRPHHKRRSPTAAAARRHAATVVKAAPRRRVYAAPPPPPLRSPLSLTRRPFRRLVSVDAAAAEAPAVAGDGGPPPSPAAAAVCNTHRAAAACAAAAGCAGAAVCALHCRASRRDAATTSARHR